MDKDQIDSARSAATMYGYVIEALLKDPQNQELLHRAKHLRKRLKRFEKSIKELLNSGKDTDIFAAVSEDDDEGVDIDTDMFIEMMRDHSEDVNNDEGK